MRDGVEQPFVFVVERDFVDEVDTTQTVRKRPQPLEFARSFGKVAAIPRTSSGILRPRK